jgi:hypothetical protein
MNSLENFAPAHPADSSADARLLRFEQRDEDGEEEQGTDALP